MFERAKLFEWTLCGKCSEGGREREWLTRITTPLSKVGVYLTCRAAMTSLFERYYDVSIELTLFDSNVIKIHFRLSHLTTISSSKNRICRYEICLNYSIFFRWKEILNASLFNVKLLALLREIIQTMFAQQWACLPWKFFA